jgi:Tol biopolymer transport system component
MKMKTKNVNCREYYWIISAAVLLALFAGSGFTDSEEQRTPTNTTQVLPEPMAQPVNFGPVINTKLRQAEPSFTADGKTMYFNCQVRPDRSGNDICVSSLTGNLEDANWATPEVVAPGVISLKETFDAEPLISTDGKKLFFVSTNRPGGYGETDLWYSENVDGVWQSPKNLGSPFNTPFSDHCLMFSADGNEAFWTSTRPGGFGGNDIWTSRKVDGIWQSAVNLGSNVNSSYSDHHSLPSPNGKSLYVTSGRLGGFGGEDIYVTTRDDSGAWGPLVNLGPLVNTDKDDRCPSLTPDLRIMMFDSERAGGHGSKDLWWVYYDKVSHIR